MMIVAGDSDDDGDVDIRYETIYYSYYTVLSKQLFDMALFQTLPTDIK